MSQTHPEHDQEPGSAAERLAAALGWDSIPELGDDEAREADEKLQAAKAQARRLYGWTTQA